MHAQSFTRKHQISKYLKKWLRFESLHTMLIGERKGDAGEG